MNTDRKHISTTHNERYYHIELPEGSVATRATVFFRQTTPRDTADPDNDWEASVALCDHRDQFVKQIGRNVARRKWFTDERYLVRGKPDFTTAELLAKEALGERQSYAKRA